MTGGGGGRGSPYRGRHPRIGAGQRATAPIRRSALAQTGSSTLPWGAPISARRSRKGAGGKASGRVAKELLEPTAAPEEQGGHRLRGPPDLLGDHGHRGTLEAPPG